MTDPPAFREVRDYVQDELVRFVRSLRRAGVDVPGNAGVTAARALVEVGFDDETRARAALRACLVTDATDVSTFDRQFPEFWRRLMAGVSLDGPAPRDDDAGPEGALAPLGDATAGDDTEDASAAPDAGGDGDAAGPSPVETALGGVVDRASADAGDTEAAWYSPAGAGSGIESTGISDDERALASAFETLTPALRTLRGRRWRADGEDRVSARRALRESFGTGGTVVSVPRRERDFADVRALWFVDVSRSVLDTVDRAFLLAALRYARATWRDCRVVFFDEDAREVSEAFDAPTPTHAEDALSRAEAAWGGGTRIGDSLAGFRDHAREYVDYRTTVFVVSDGLEMGDVSTLERELAWLSARAAGVVWLNPLAASPDYEPTARGMARALPFVDGVFAFGDADDLAEVGRQLRRGGFGGRIGYEYDPRRGVN